MTRKEFSLDVQVPDSITAWHVDGLSISNRLGLALAEPVQLTTFKHFLLDFKLPYTVGEGRTSPDTADCAQLHGIMRPGW